MGYISNYSGDIFTDKEEVALFLKHIKRIGDKAEWASSGSKGITTDWFHKCDEWLCYIPDLEIGEKKIKINSSGNHYQQSVENLCLIIAMLDSDATGKIYWDAEDRNDKGTITIKGGKVFIKHFREEREEYSEQKIWTYGKVDRIVEPKYDFIKMLKKGIRLNRLKEYLVVENL